MSLLPVIFNGLLAVFLGTWGHSPPPAWADSGTSAETWECLRSSIDSRSAGWEFLSPHSLTLIPLGKPHMPEAKEYSGF